MSVGETFAERHPMCQFVLVVERHVYVTAAHLVVGKIVVDRFVVCHRIPFATGGKRIAGCSNKNFARHDRGSSDIGRIMVVVE